MQWKPRPPLFPYHGSPKPLVFHAMETATEIFPYHGSRDAHFFHAMENETRIFSIPWKKRRTFFHAMENDAAAPDRRGRVACVLICAELFS